MKNKKNTKEKSVPFRLSEAWLDTLQGIKMATGIPKQQLLEDAANFYLGKKDR